MNEPMKTPGQKDDPTLQWRMLLAFALMGVVLFATPYFFKSMSPPAPAKSAANQKAVTNPGPAAAAAEAASKPIVSAAPEASAPGLLAAHDEQLTTIETDLYKISFSNRGATVHSWTLKKFQNDKGQPLELVNPLAVAKAGYPMSYQFRQSVSVDLNQALFVASQSGQSITFEFHNGQVTARKYFEFEPNSYLSKVSSEITQNGVPLPHMLSWRGGFGDLAVNNAAAQDSAIHFELSDQKLIKAAAKSAKNGPVNTDGQYSFAGVEDQYFAAAFLPAGNGTLWTTTFDDAVPTPYDKSEQAFVGTAVGGEGTNRLQLFVGPKDIDLLKQVNPKLEQIVDFGWFSILAKPLYLVLHWLNDGFVHNYGWSIVLATVAINLLLLPLRFTNMKSMKKMQAIQPHVAVINEKYKSMSFKDPRMSQKNEETMALYKEHGVNPMGGCLPLVVQMPFLFAFYKVLSISIELRHASWLWVTDLSQAEHLAIHVLPVLMVLTGFLMQRMTPVAGGDPQQQKMMQFMPLMMAFFFYSQSAGLVLYWLTGNVVGILQQWLFNKTLTPAVVPPPPRMIAKKGGRK
jgi:YidC/Oxa1 family membrane protein insertase